MLGTEQMFLHLVFEKVVIWHDRGRKGFGFGARMELSAVRPSWIA